MAKMKFKGLGQMPRMEVGNLSQTEIDRTPLGILKDSDCLSLHRAKAGHRWMFYYRVLQDDTQTIHRISIGSYPETPLDEARARAVEFYNWAATGMDPVTKRTMRLSQLFPSMSEEVLHRMIQVRTTEKMRETVQSGQGLLDFGIEAQYAPNGPSKSGAETVTEPESTTVSEATPSGNTEPEPESNEDKEKVEAPLYEDMELGFTVRGPAPKNMPDRASLRIKFDHKLSELKGQGPRDIVAMGPSLLIRAGRDELGEVRGHWVFICYVNLFDGSEPFRHRVNIGFYPEVSISEAIERASLLHGLVLVGGNPMVKRLMLADEWFNGRQRPRSMERPRSDSRLALKAKSLKAEPVTESRIVPVTSEPAPAADPGSIQEHLDQAPVPNVGQVIATSADDRFLAITFDRVLRLTAQGKPIPMMEQMAAEQALARFTKDRGITIPAG